MKEEKRLFNRWLNNKNGFRIDSGNKERISQLLIEGIANLERGLRVLDRNLILTKRPLDILAVDLLGELVIIELEVGDDETVILRALEHFDWILNNINSIVQKYNKDKIDITLAPRIIIVGGNFGEDFIRKLSYVNTTKIELYEYELKNEDGISHLILRPYALSVSVQKNIEISKPRFEDLINSIKILSLRQLCHRIIRELRNINIDATVDTSRGFIEMQEKGKILLRVYPQTDFFWVSFSSHGRWQGIKVDEVKKGEEIIRRLREGEFN
ncbi:MAG: hypothetical protein NC818_00675 [Candidatus Omnitrophica bacterium]|nr:hypothetical protein [Candidatus Omnitrophota bacterium]